MWHTTECCVYCPCAIAGHQVLRHRYKRRCRGYHVLCIKRKKKQKRKASCGPNHVRRARYSLPWSKRDALLNSSWEFDIAGAPTAQMFLAPSVSLVAYANGDMSCCNISDSMFHCGTYWGVGP